MKKITTILLLLISTISFSQLRKFSKYSFTDSLKFKTFSVSNPSGYATNVNGSLGDLDFTTKKREDSLRALAGVYVDTVYINSLKDSIITHKNGNRYATALPNGVKGWSDLSGYTSTQAGATYTTPNDGQTRIYNVAAKIGITAISGATITTTVTYTDETNTSRTITFYSMGSTTAGLTTTGVSSFPVLGEIVCYPNTAITVTATLAGGTATYNFNSTITYIRTIAT